MIWPTNLNLYNFFKYSISLSLMFLLATISFVFIYNAHDICILSRFDFGLSSSPSPLFTIFTDSLPLFLDLPIKMLAVLIVVVILRAAIIVVSCSVCFYKRKLKRSRDVETTINVDLWSIAKASSLCNSWFEYLDYFFLFGIRGFMALG